MSSDDDESIIIKARFFSINIKFSLVLVIIYPNVIVTELLNKVKDNI